MHAHKKMKSRLNRFSKCHVLLRWVGLLCSFAVGAGLHAQTVYWDGANTASNSVIDGGTGTWSAAGNNWTDSTGSTNSIWPAGTSVPVFQGTTGTVTLSGTQNAGGLNFQVGNYQLTGGTLGFGNAAGNTVLVNTGTATVGSVLSSANPITKTGIGTLSLTGSNGATLSSAFTVSQGTLSGVLSVTSGGTTNAFGTGVLSISNGATLAINDSSTLAATTGDYSFNSITGAGNINQGARLERHALWWTSKMLRRPRGW